MHHLLARFRIRPRNHAKRLCVQSPRVVTRALVIAPQPFFSPRGTPLSVYYRTLVTAELGIDVHLLTYGEGQDVDIPNVKTYRIPRLPWFGHVKTGPSLLKLFLDGFLILWTLKLLFTNKYDIVHAHEEAVFYCRFLKPLFRFKLIYDMHSSLPQQLTNFRFTKSHVLLGLFGKLENTSIRNADAVITICPALAEYAESVLGHKENHFLIENSLFDEVRLMPVSSSNKSKGPPNLPEIGLPHGKRFFVYAGTLEPYQGIDLLIDAFSLIYTSIPGMALLIVGGSEAQVSFYRQRAEAKGITHSCSFTGIVPPATARRLIRMGSALVSPRIAGSNTPLKIYEQLASGIPLVATNISSHTQVLTDDVAFLVDPAPDDMARGIFKALNSREEALAKARSAKRLYAEKYSRQAYEHKMQQLFELVKRQPRQRIESPFSQCRTKKRRVR
jgi:glycosyltransferase involved in cell wall biosynthesis